MERGLDDHGLRSRLARSVPERAGDACPRRRGSPARSDSRAGAPPQRCQRRSVPRQGSASRRSTMVANARDSACCAPTVTRTCDGETRTSRRAIQSAPAARCSLTTGARRIVEQRRAVRVGANLQSSGELRDMRVRRQRVQRQVKQRRIVRSRERTHVGAAADLATDQPAARCKLIRPGDRAHRDANRRGEVALRRKTVAGSQVTLQNVPAQRFDDLQIRWPPVGVDLRLPYCHSYNIRIDTDINQR